MTTLYALSSSGWKVQCISFGWLAGWRLELGTNSRYAIFLFAESALAVKKNSATIAYMATRNSKQLNPSVQLRRDQCHKL